MLRLALLLCLAWLCRADLPIDCRFSDAVGTWVFSETERTGGPSLDCSVLGETRHTKEFTLAYPNTVTDELENTGTWTLIYNQGFEVNINERSYWAPFYYETDPNGFSCTRLFNGWARDQTVRNWACFTAVKNGTENFSDKLQSYTTPSVDGDEMYVNDRAFIERINAAQDSWRATAYPQHEKYTVREMLLRGGATYTALPSAAPASAELKARASLLPTNFDWRNVEGVNYLSPVRDQKSCGSCYSFASAGLLESRLRILTDLQRQDIFSTQDVVDCTELAEGCLGGFSYLIAGRYAKDQGFVSEACNLYEATDGVCDTDPTCGRTYVSSYEYVGGYYGASNEENMMEQLILRGPLAVDFNVESDFYAYSNGIYHHVSEVKSDFDPLYVVNHAVLLVGYGVEPETGENFWIVKNSWGGDWGEDGYFRIRRGTNEVGIESAAFDVTVIP